jgi:hypothetical protein
MDEKYDDGKEFLESVSGDFFKVTGEGDTCFNSSPAAAVFSALVLALALFASL